MQRGKTGRYEITTIGGEKVRAFIPDPLPPEPPLDRVFAYNQYLAILTEGTEAL